LATVTALARRGVATLLFAGPEGAGRRAAARWFAAVLNCESGAEQPCGQCRACRRWVGAGDEPLSIDDYREIAAPATTKEGRPARRRVIAIDQLVPRPDGDPDPLGPWLVARPTARVRVGVILGADELGEPAANAFLKTLEEPPAHARIVLIGSGPDALLPTVASRCTVVRFRPRLDAGEPLGGPAGPTLTNAAARTAPEPVRRVTADFVTTLDGGLGATFAALAALEAVWPPEDATVPSLLRAWARQRGPNTYLACDAALVEAETAVAAYAHRGLARVRLALALRRAWQRAP
jgi:DNA polymerase III subunit delta'